MHTQTPETLIDLLQSRAAHETFHARGFRFLDSHGNTEKELPYRELNQQAQAIAVRLTSAIAPGDRALMLYPPGHDFVCGFFGCLYANVIAVPAYPPDPTRLARSLPRLLAIVKDAQPTCVLTTSAILAMAEALFPMAPELKSLKWIATDTVDLATASQWTQPKLADNALAFLQYTSGSTGNPKGVMVSHRNLLHNQTLIQWTFDQDENSVVVGWLPLYHDMGLIGNVLQPLFVGAQCVLMSPMTFLKYPIRWLEAISTYRGTTCTAPNFAYDLCVRKVKPEQKEKLDLSSWTHALNGAEPVRAETLRNFVEAFGPCGFRAEVFYPCYGLAEGTLLVAGRKSQAVAPTIKTLDARALEQHDVKPIEHTATTAVRHLVSCGIGGEDQTIAIVDPETKARCAPGRVGEIWLKSASVAGGYWNRAFESEETFGAYLSNNQHGPFLRTGDLGFVENGELYVTGRLKDMIIVRGQNYYPSDVELAAERAHAAIRPGSCIAFAFDQNGAERVAIVAELDKNFAGDTSEIPEAVRTAVAKHCALDVHAVYLVTAGSIPKTSSGKLQRRACRIAMLEGSLEVVHQHIV